MPRISIERTCERIVAAWSPWRLAGIMLAAILVANVLPLHAQAHGGGTEEAIQGDNLLRWGIGNGMTLWAFSDDATLCPSVSCGSGAPDDSEWRNPPNSGLSAGVQGGTILERLDRLALLGQGGATDSNEKRIFATFIGAGATGGPTNQSTANQTIFNVTWTGNVTATNLKYRLDAGGTAGSGSVSTWFSLWDYQNASVGSFVGPVFNCGASLATDITNVTFPSTVFQSFRINVTTSACTFSDANTWDMSIMDLVLYSKENLTEAIARTTPALEFGDWLVGRCLVTSGVCEDTTDLISGPGAFSDLTTNAPVNFTVVLEAGATHYAYFTVSCHVENTRCGNTFQTPWPVAYQPNQIQNSCLSATFMGPTISIGQQWVMVWNLTNMCTSTTLVDIGGTICSTSSCRLKHFDQFKAFPGEQTSTFLNFNFTTDVLAQNPRAARLYDWVAQPHTVGLIYRSTFHPFHTRSVPAAFAQAEYFSNDIERSLYSSSDRTTGTTSFSPVVRPREYYGNAIYFAFGSNETGTEAICDSNVTVNGVLSPISKTIRQTTTYNQGGSRVADWCFVLIDDLNSRYGGGINATTGDAQLQDNSHPAETYSVSIQWDSSLGALNAGQGSLIYTPANFTNNLSDGVQCNRVQTLCFGNHDVTGFSIYGSTEYNWIVQQTNATGTDAALPSARVEEAGSGAAALTNASGRASFSLTSDPNTEWFVTRVGYHTARLNFTNVTATRINVSVLYPSANNMSAVNIQRSFCDTASAGVLTCVIFWIEPDDPSNSVDLCGGSIDVAGPNPGCTDIPRRWVFSCPLDLAAGSQILNASVADANSDYRALITECSPLDDLSFQSDATTTAIGPTAALTIARPGYRTISFNVTPASTVGFVAVRTSMIPGFSDAPASEVNVTTSTQLIRDPYDGRSKTALYVTAVDVGEPQRTVGGIIPRGTPPLSVIIMNFADTTMFNGLAGHFLFGLILVGLIVAAFLGLHMKMTDEAPSATFAAIIAFPAVLFVTAVGLWPFWVPVGIVLLIVSLIYVTWGRD